MMALSDLIAGSEIKTNVAFSIACFFCFLGFFTSIAMYAYYGFWLQKDMTPGLQAITIVFVGQGFLSLVVALFNKPTAGTT